jgi:tRNA A37 threonylcarbamoyladenosine synthetase subunit TsaC/SUA5/YrdC
MPPPRLLHSGGVLAYPTEAVFGLGCDPHDHARSSGCSR